MRNLMATLRDAVKGGPNAAENDDSEMEDDETETETASEDDGDQPAAEEDGDEPNAEGDEDEPAAGEDEDKPSASVRRRIAGAERARILAIITHPNADAQPKLAVSMIQDGTSKAKALATLDAVEAAPPSGDGGTPGNSLADRVRRSQGNRRPGSDAPKGKNESSILTNARARKAPRNSKGA